MKDYQIFDRDLNNLGPRKYSIENDTTVGRFLIAIEDIEEGQLILREDAFQWGPKFDTRPVCLGCYKYVYNASILCKRCGWPMCSYECQNHPDHAEAECQLFTTKLTKQIKAETFNYQGVERMYDVISPIRIFLLVGPKNNHHPFWQLMSHIDEWKTQNNWLSGHYFIIQYMLETLQLNDQITETDILTIFGICYTNDFNVSINVAGQSPSKIRLCYILASLCSHSCVPNATKYISGHEASFRIDLRAKQRIKKGEKINIDYVDFFLPKIVRQSYLLEGKKFECCCTRCCSNDGQYAALVCEKCSFSELSNNSQTTEEIKYAYMLPSLKSGWICTKCEFQKSSESVLQTFIDAINQKASVMWESFTSPDPIAVYENLLIKLSQKFHPKNLILAEIEFNLAGMYGRISGYQMHEMTDKTIARKKKLCESLLEILNILDQGRSSRKGMLFYELHMVLMMETQKSLQYGRMNGPQAKQNFSVSLRYLKDALQLLKDEPFGTFERNVYEGAKNSLKPLKNYVDKIY